VPPRRGDELAESLAPLVELHAAHVRTSTFHADIDGLVAMLRRALGERTPADLLRGASGPASQAFLVDWSDDLAQRAFTVVARLGLLEQAAQPSYVQAGIGEAAGAVVAIKQRIAAVRDLARLESGQINVRPADVDVSEVARRVTRMVARRSFASLAVTAPDALAAHLDRAMVLAVMYHLAAFAVERSQLGATKMEVVQRGERVCITLCDHGLWLSAAQVAKLRDFRPLGPGARTRYSGDLAGVAVAIGFVDAMGGQRQVVSMEGRTVVDVDLPRVCGARRGSPRHDDETEVAQPPQ
jgi:K+-sensing histidine kinase KdpD